MQRSRSILFAGLLAAPLMLASSAALAGTGAATCFLTASSCEFDVTGGCDAQCTPGNFTANCETQCTKVPVEECTTSCTAGCTAQPPSITCDAYCSQDCKGRCATSCSGVTGECQTDCEADCDNRCNVGCTASPGSIDCGVACQQSCTVQANVVCQTKCVDTVTLPACEASCSLPGGALFCDGQYISLEKAGQDCVDWLATQGFSLSGSCTATLSGSACSAAVGCSAAPSVGAASDRWGVAGLTGLMMGLGLLVSRRKRS